MPFHRQLILGPVEVDLLPPEDDEGSTDDAFNRHDGKVEVRFYGETLENFQGEFVTLIAIEGLVDTNFPELAQWSFAVTGAESIQASLKDTGWFTLDTSDDPERLGFRIPERLHSPLIVALDDYRANMPITPETLARIKARGKVPT